MAGKILEYNMRFQIMRLEDESMLQVSKHRDGSVQIRVSKEHLFQPIPFKLTYKEAVSLGVFIMGHNTAEDPAIEPPSTPQDP